MKTELKGLYGVVFFAGLTLMNTAYDLLPSLGISPFVDSEGDPQNLFLIIALAVWVGLFLRRDWAWSVAVILLPITLFIRGSILYNAEPYDSWFLFYFVANIATLIYLLLPKVRNEFVTDLVNKPVMPSSAEKYSDSKDNVPSWLVTFVSLLLMIVIASVFVNVFVIYIEDGVDELLSIGLIIISLVLLELRKWGWLIAIFLVTASIALHIYVWLSAGEANAAFIGLFVVNILTLILLLFMYYRNHVKPNPS